MMAVSSSGPLINLRLVELSVFSRNIVEEDRGISLIVLIQYQLSNLFYAMDILIVSIVPIFPAL
jgi:hypothetical protein